MKSNPKLQIKVDGMMSEQDAGKVGNKLANAVVIATTMFGIAVVITAIGMLLK